MRGSGPSVLAAPPPAANIDEVEMNRSKPETEPPNCAFVVLSIISSGRKCRHIVWDGTEPVDDLPQVHRYQCRLREIAARSHPREYVGLFTLLAMSTVGPGRDLTPAVGDGQQFHVPTKAAFTSPTWHTNHSGAGRVPAWRHSRSFPDPPIVTRCGGYLESLTIHLVTPAGNA